MTPADIDRAAPLNHGPAEASLPSILDRTMSGPLRGGTAARVLAASTGTFLHQQARHRGQPTSPVRSLLHSAGIATGPEPAHDPAPTRPYSVLPLTQLIDTSTDPGRYWAVTPVDDRGRLADRTPLHVLSWGPGTPITICANPAAGLIAVSLGGAHAVSGQGRLRLPADIRHECRLNTGDRLLIVAYPAEGLLVGYLPRTLDAMTSAFHTAVRAKENEHDDPQRG